MTLKELPIAIKRKIAETRDLRLKAGADSKKVLSGRIEAYNDSLDLINCVEPTEQEMKVKQFLALFKYNSKSTLIVEAETEDKVLDTIWRGTLDQFKKKDPTINYDCDAYGEKISDQPIDEVVFDDGIEDSLTIYLNGDRRYLEAD
jgi:hypothetical protein